MDKNGAFHTYNSDRTTEHFIVINGVEYDNVRGLYFLKYIETGRNLSSSNGAISDDNKIYYNPDNSDKVLEGSNWRKEKYVIVQIRPNL